MGRIVDATTARNPHDYIDEHRRGGGGNRDAMQLRDRPLKLHADAAVTEAPASNIPAA